MNSEVCHETDVIKNRKEVDFMEDENKNLEESGGAVTEAPEENKVNYDEKAEEINNRQRFIEEQDQKLLAALDEVLERRSKKIEVDPEPKVQKIARGVARKGVGFVSLALILMFLGVVMICCLFSPAHDFTLPLKLSPVCAVFIGLEILANQMLTRGRFRINIPSMIISAALVVGCCVMCVALNKTSNQQQQEYNNRSIAAEIYDASYRELRHSVDIATLEVSVDLNPDGSGKLKGLEALSTDDYVDIKVSFAGVIRTPQEFASNCKKVIDGYRFMGISVTNFYFVNESALHSFKLNVEGRFAQDSTESELLEKVSHIYLDNIPYIEDLEDFVIESDPAA